MNSCDFSLSNYSYAPVEGDKELEHFSIEEDRDDIIPMIKEAMAMRTPVIATRMVGIPELLDDGRCGVLVPPQDANSIAEAIILLVVSL